MSFANFLQNYDIICKPDNRQQLRLLFVLQCLLSSYFSYSSGTSITLLCPLWFTVQHIPLSFTVIKPLETARWYTTIVLTVGLPLCCLHIYVRLSVLEGLLFFSLRGLSLHFHKGYCNKFTYRKTCRKQLGWEGTSNVSERGCRVKGN